MTRQSKVRVQVISGTLNSSG